MAGRLKAGTFWGLDWKRGHKRDIHEPSCWCWGKLGTHFDTSVRNGSTRHGQERGYTVRDSEKQKRLLMQLGHSGNVVVAHVAKVRSTPKAFKLCSPTAASGSF